MELKKVHEDGRGIIHVIENLLSDNKEYTIMEIKKGTARGGCYHSKEEYYSVISGKIRYMEGTIGGPYQEKILLPGNGGTNKANFAHLFIALEDSIISEWGLTLEEKDLDKKDSKLRKMVEEA